MQLIYCFVFVICIDQPAHQNPQLVQAFSLEKGSRVLVTLFVKDYGDNQPTTLCSLHDSDVA